MSVRPNHLLEAARAGRVCPTFGVKIVTSLEIVGMAKHAGFEALFLDLEHSALSILDAQQLCIGALSAGMSPYVRVPADCGTGYVQKILDNGAMGVIFPHIDTATQGQAAVRICKYPGVGKRSVVGAMPQLGFTPLPLKETMEVINESASSVVLMIESQEGVDNVDEIASLEGVDCIFVGSNDLSVELGVPGDFSSPVFGQAIDKIAAAAKKHGKIFGIAGMYNRPDLLQRYIKELGLCFVVGSQDIVLLSQGSHQASKALHQLAA